MSILSIFGESLANVLGAVFNIIWGTLCIIIYGLISMFFRIFIRITELDILSTTDLSGIYQRVTMILTIVMVFYITFTFVKYVVSPDTITDKEKGAGGTIKRIIIAIILIAFVPTIFSYGYKIQNRLIKTQVFSKVILGEKNIEYEKIGRNFAGDVFSAFYRVDYDICESLNTCAASEKNVNHVITVFKENGGAVANVEAMFAQIQPGVEFDGLLAVIFGGFVVYILILYCMDVGVRYAQLLFLQITAPIAIIGSISPQKDNMLKKWSKQCLTTYIDLFLRLAIIYFVILIIGILGDSLKISEMSRNGDRPGFFVYLFMVAGLLIFAQKAPKMIKELLPSSGGAASIGFGFGSKERFEPLKKSFAPIGKTAAMAAVGATGVGRMLAKTKLGTNIGNKLKGSKIGKTTAAVKGKWANRLSDPNSRLNKTWSEGKALYKGMAEARKTGRFNKGMVAAEKSREADQRINEKGGSVIGHDFFGEHYRQEKVKLGLEIEYLDGLVNAKKGVSTAIENIKFRKQMDKMGEALVASGNAEAAKAWDGEKKSAEKFTRMFASGMIGEAEYIQKMEKIATDFNAKYNLTGTGAAVAINNEDLELKNISKWSSVRTALNEAKSQASDIAKSNISYVTRDKDGNNVNIKIGCTTDPNTGEIIKQIVTYETIDKNTGTVTTKTEDYVFAKFGEIIGDLTDVAESAAGDIKASQDYKMTQANASEDKK